MTKEELKEYANIKRELHQVEEQIEKLRYEKNNFIKSCTFSDMPKNPNIYDNKIETLLIKIEEAEEKYINLYSNLLEVQTKIENVINTLDPRERVLMRYRYIECKSWEEISVLINYSWKQTHRIHSKILQKIEKMTLNDTQKCDNIIS